MAKSRRHLQDEQILLRIFPAEVWDKLLSTKYISSSLVVQNLDETSPFFQQRLSDNGVIWKVYFSDIWQVPGHQFYMKRNAGAVINRELVLVISPYKDPVIQRFLKKYGKEIWYCTLGISVQLSEKLQCYRKLRHILTLLPNLKELSVHYGHLGCGKREACDGPAPRKHEPVTIKRYLHDLPFDGCGLNEDLVANPLPVLRNLRYLSVTDLPEFVKQVLMTAYSKTEITFQKFYNIDVEWTSCLQAIEVRDSVCYERMSAVELKEMITRARIEKLQIQCCQRT